MRLIEHYLSIQGEGVNPGKLSYFVRFARCNLRCRWCDSKKSFDPGTAVPFETVARAIQKSRAKIVCLTGGEPLLQTEECLKLIRRFPDLHFDIETGGASDIRPVQTENTSVIMDWKLHHSGMLHKMKEKNLAFLRPETDLLKFVTDFSAHDRKEILKVAKKTRKSGFPISLQPLYGEGTLLTDPEPIADWMVGLKDPRFQFNLQVHKHIWGFGREKV